MPLTWRLSAIIGYMNLAGHQEQRERRGDGSAGGVRRVEDTGGGGTRQSPCDNPDTPHPYILCSSAERGLCEAPTLDLQCTVRTCDGGRVCTEWVFVYGHVYIAMSSPLLCLLTEVQVSGLLVAATMGAGGGDDMTHTDNRQPH